MSQQKNKIISETERLKNEKEKLQKTAQKSNPMYRSVSQDEIMGYEEDFFEDDYNDEF